MQYFDVSIKSSTYSLRAAAHVLANSEEQAAELAGAQFHEQVNNFLRASHDRRSSEPYKEIPKDVLLRNAGVVVKLISSTPMVVKSEWDRIK
jgi:hypothetical protein